MDTKEFIIAFVVVAALIFIMTFSIDTFDDEAEPYEAYSMHTRLDNRRPEAPKPQKMRRVPVPSRGKKPSRDFPPQVLPTPMVSTGPPASTVIPVREDEEGQRGGGPPSWAMARGNKFGLKRRLGMTQTIRPQNPAAAEDMDRPDIITRRPWEPL